MSRITPIGVIAAFLMLVLLSSCTVGRFFVWNFADINDHKKFAYHEVERGGEVFSFHKADKKVAPTQVNFGSGMVQFDDALEQNKTVAFAVIRRDTILYEQYWDGYTETSIVPSFSMAKSVTSMLIGCAIEDGYIGGVDDLLTDYLPELGERGFEKVTLEHVLQMTSGMKFNEGYKNPFGEAAKFYYGRDLRRLSTKLKATMPPGEEFDYVSGNTQLLGLVLERVLPEGMTVSDYLSARIWRRIGMKEDATWSVDKKKQGMEKTFCCLNSNTYDYAKLGRLYLHDGRWGGEQIVPKDWVEASTRLDTTEGSASYYQYQWWLPTPGEDFMAEGILGQYIYVHPAKELIIVRLGKKNGAIDWWELFKAMSSFY